MSNVVQFLATALRGSRSIRRYHRSPQLTALRHSNGSRLVSLPWEGLWIDESV